MKLRAIHAIYRMEGKKQVRVEPNSEFDCPKDEADDYVASGAAVAVEAKKPAKAAPKKGKATAKDAAPEADDAGDAGDDEGLLD